MQLSKQCTWISLNLTRISNQARRWVEGVFSSSMYALIIQMCKREPPKASQQLFMSWLKKTSHWLFSMCCRRAHRTHPSSHRTRPVWTRTASGALDHTKTSRCRWTRHDTGLSTWNAPDGLEWDQTKTQRGSPKRHNTGRTTRMRPVSHWTRHRALKLSLHRTLNSDASGVTPDTSGVQRTQTQRATCDSVYSLWFTLGSTQTVR